MKYGKRITIVGLSAVLGAGSIVVSGSAAGADADDPLRCDFNGDGYADLAVGTPFENVGSIEEAGAVNVIYGSASGLTDTGNVIIDQGAGVPGALEDFDRFGQRLGCGDVDGDGYSELIVATPRETYASKFRAGTIHVFPGSATGIDLAETTMIHRASVGIDGGPRRFEQWGDDFVVADLNGDDHADLFIGTLHLDDAFVFIPGSASGLDTLNSFRVTETADVAADEWRIAAVGDFTGDTIEDVVLEGNAPLTAGGSYAWRHRLVPGSLSGPDWAAADDFYFVDGGVSVATDVDADGDDDLLTIDGQYLVVAHGSPGGFDDTVQAYADIGGTGALSSTQSLTMAAADLDGDGRDEIVLGARWASVGDSFGAGVAVVLPATPTGHDLGVITVWHQNTETIVGTAQGSDGFGASLSAGDFDGSGEADLAAGVPGEGLGPGRNDAGAVNVIYGSPTGLTDANNQMWHQGRPGIAGALEALDYFGTSLAG